MKTKVIYGIEYKVIDFKEWQDIKMPDENTCLEAEVVRIGSIECGNLFVEGAQVVKGYQIVEGHCNKLLL